MSEPLLKYRQPTAPQDILTEAVPARMYTEGSGLNLARAALFGVGLDKVTDIVELLRTYRGGKPNSLIMGGPMGWSWYATLDTAHHGALAGPANAHRHSDLANIGVNDHHARDHATRHHSGGADALALGSIAGNLTDAQHGSRTVANAHAHSHLSGIGVNDHHARDHVLATNTGLGATHTISGAAAGQVLRATSATAAQFAQLQHGDLGGVSTDQHHAQAHTLASHSTKAHTELTGVTSDQHHAQSHSHASHTGIGASDHHAKTTSFADLTDRAGASKLNWGSNKLLQGAGAGSDPTEIGIGTGANDVAAGDHTHTLANDVNGYTKSSVATLGAGAMAPVFNYQEITGGGNLTLASKTLSVASNSRQYITAFSGGLSAFSGTVFKQRFYVDGVLVSESAYLPVQSSSANIANEYTGALSSGNRTAYTSIHNHSTTQNVLLLGEDVGVNYELAVVFFGSIKI